MFNLSVHNQIKPFFLSVSGGLSDGSRREHNVEPSSLGWELKGRKRKGWGPRIPFKGNLIP